VTIILRHEQMLKRQLS